MATSGPVAMSARPPTIGLLARAALAGVTGDRLLAWQRRTGGQAERATRPSRSGARLPLAAAVLCALLAAGPSSALRCSACRRDAFVGTYHNDFRNMRIATSMPKPYCSGLDSIQCDRNENVCLTMTMDLGGAQGYWIQMGCSTAQFFRHYTKGANRVQELVPRVDAADRSAESPAALDECYELAVEQRETFYDVNYGGRKRVQHRVTPQRVCACDADNCNRSPRAAGMAPAATVTVSLITAFLFVSTLLCTL